MRGLIQSVKSVWKAVQEKIEYRKAWEVVGKQRYYDTIVAQESGYVVHIYERKQYENPIDGATKEGIETEVDSVWRLYNRSNWEPGYPIEYDGEMVECAETANMFNQVARGYRR